MTTKQLSPTKILKLPGSQNLMNELLERFDRALLDIAEEVAEREGIELVPTDDSNPITAQLWAKYYEAEARVTRTLAFEFYTQLMGRARR